MKSSLFLFLVCVGFSSLWAQPVPRTVVVEHFTNTKCSVCASRNPGFYQTLAQQPQVLHIAYHPSSPYSTCGFSKHNPAENDSRTNFYGVYGATPRLVIQGNVIAGNANYASAAIYTPYAGATSAFSVRVMTNRTADSLHTRIVIQQVDTFAAAQSLTLFAGIAEDTVQFSGGNGEKTHFDVFRKSLYGETPLPLGGLGQIGDSIVLVSAVALNAAWNPTQLYSYALLKRNKSIVQAAQSPKAQLLTAISPAATGSIFSVSPNPVQQWLRISPKAATATPIQFSLFDVQGKQLRQLSATETEYMDMQPLTKGIYYLQACENLCTETIAIEKQ